MKKDINDNGLDSIEQEKTVEEDTCKSELLAVKEQLVRLGADFQNYRKRIEKDRSEWSQSAQAQIILDLFPLIDDFDRAISEAQKEGINPEFGQWIAGFELMHKAFYEFLKNKNVEEIDQIKEFDPELHEALMQVESDEHESGQIVQVMQRGFLLNGKVLRPAKVSVAK